MAPPRLRASTALLSSAGGWVGALIGDPLRSGLGGFGATIVLVAVAVVAMVLFTGVSVRAATGGIVGAVRWSAAVARERTGLDDDEEARRSRRAEDEPTDPFGRRVAGAGRGPSVDDRDEDDDEEEDEEEDESEEDDPRSPKPDAESVWPGGRHLGPARARSWR